MHCRYSLRVAASGTALSLVLADPLPVNLTSSFHVRAAAVEQGSSLLVQPAPGPTPEPSPGPDHHPTGATSRLAVPLSADSVAAPLRRRVRFAGATDVRVAALGQVASDPVPMPVTAGQQLIVDLEVDPGDAPRTVAGWEHNRCVPLAGGTATTDGPVQWLSGVRVLGPAVRTVAALGDSITEGAGLASGSYLRWTDRLAAGGSDVLNEGLSGGAVGRAGLYGSTDGVTRDRTLIAEPGLTDVVVALGTNDLSLGATSAQVLDAIDHVIAADRARGVHTWVSTIAPRGSRTLSFAQEPARQSINAALRGTWLTSRQAGLVDSDAALRDPAFPRQLLPAYTDGDLVHPNAAGELAIAAQVASALHLPASR